MQSEITRLQAQRIINAIDRKWVIDWAASALSEGNDTPSLRILAGLPVKSLDDRDIDNYLDQTNSEFGYPRLDREDCLLRYAQLVATDIASGSISPSAGCAEMLRITHHGCDDLMNWISIAEDLYLAKEKTHGTVKQAEQEIITSAKKLCFSDLT